jgi:hypothetical protein
MMTSRTAPAGPARAPGREPARAPRPEAAPRRCLTCGESFPSGGPHERVCPACKEGEDWLDAVAACQGHINW